MPRLLLSLLLPALAPSAAAQMEILVPGDLEGGDRFGDAVALDGSTLVVGAPWQGASPYGPGAAYVFERAGGVWTQTAKFAAPPGTNGFGDAVALAGDVIAVGAPLDGEAAVAAGAVFVFERAPAGWQLAAKLLPPSAAPGTRFGASVTVSGTWILAGAPGDPRLELEAGSAAVFHRRAGTWAAAADLLPPEPVLGGHFGNSVALARGLAVVGQPGGALGGAAFVYEAPSPVPSARLAGAAGADSGSFGTAVATDGRRIAVGAPNEDGEEALEIDVGRVHVFERLAGVWTETALVADPREQHSGLLGYSVALQGEHLLAGAWQKELAGGEYGAALLYEQGAGGFALSEVLTAQGPGPTQAGIAVALSRDTALAGAPLTPRPAPLYGGVVLLLPLL